jgi:hypothetical protein
MIISCADARFISGKWSSCLTQLRLLQQMSCEQWIKLSRHIGMGQYPVKGDGVLAFLNMLALIALPYYLDQQLSLKFSESF